MSRRPFSNHTAQCTLQCVSLCPRRMNGCTNRRGRICTYRPRSCKGAWALPRADCQRRNIPRQCLHRRGSGTCTRWQTGPPPAGRIARAVGTGRPHTGHIEVASDRGVGHFVLAQLLRKSHSRVVVGCGAHKRNCLGALAAHAHACRLVIGRHPQALILVAVHCFGVGLCDRHAVFCLNNLAIGVMALEACDSLCASATGSAALSGGYGRPRACSKVARSNRVGLFASAQAIIDGRHFVVGAEARKRHNLETNSTDAGACGIPNLLPRTLFLVAGDILQRLVHQLALRAVKHILAGRIAAFVCGRGLDATVAHCAALAVCRHDPLLPVPTSETLLV
eukprot:Opistho-2@17639